MDGEDYLWEKQEDNWLPVGKVSIVHRKRDAITRMRGIRIECDARLSEIKPPRGVRYPGVIREQIHHAISNISRQSEQLFSATCNLGVQDGNYVAEFCFDDETLDTRHVDSTSELIALLRTPFTEGVPLRSSGDSAVRMTWNPYQDVNYNELQLLQPYIERRTPYINVDVPLPFSCYELLKRDTNEIEVVVSHDESVCPIIGANTKDHGLCWRITLDAPQDDPDLRALERSLLSDHDVSSMMIGKELFFERGRYALDIEFEVDPSTREGRVFRESKRIARVLQQKSIPPGSFQFLASEQLKYELTKQKGGVSITIQSELTGEIVKRGSLVLPERKWSVEELVEEFKEDSEGFIQSYFGENECPKDRVIDYYEMLDTIKRYLSDLKKKR